MKRKIILFWAVIIISVALCLSGCSSIAVGGKKLRRPDKISLYRLGLYSYDCDITDKKETEKIFSFFDGADFVLSDGKLSEDDGNLNFKEFVGIWFGEDCYFIDIAENGRAQCTFGDKSYITEAGAVDYTALRDFVDAKIREYLDKINTGCV